MGSRFAFKLSILFVCLSCEDIRRIQADFGNQLTPTQVKDKPMVTWDAQPDAMYTLVLTGFVNFYSESHLLSICMFCSKGVHVTTKKEI